MAIVEEPLVDLSHTAVAILRDARTSLEDNLDEFIKRYSASLQCLKEFAAPVNIAHLARCQRRYLRALFDARIDRNYLQILRNIGMEYHRIGLDVRCYLHLCSLYLDFFTPILRAHFASNSDKQAQALETFRKIVLIDMSVVLEAYDKCEDLASAASAALSSGAKFETVFDNA